MNGSASWEQLRGGERLQHVFRFCRKHRLNARTFKGFPAPTVRSDFNERHCVFLRLLIVGLSKLYDRMDT
jgi:hypothetical protein